MSEMERTIETEGNVHEYTLSVRDGGVIITDEIAASVWIDGDELDEFISYLENAKDRVGESE